MSEIQETVQTETKPKGTRGRPAKVRTHRTDVVYQQDLPKYLDKIHAEGFTTQFICPAIDVRGFQVVSYKEQ